MRRRYITHPRFQYSFTLSFVIGILLILVLIGGTAMLTVHLLGFEPGATDLQKSFYAYAVKSLFRYICLVGGILLMAVTIVGIYLSYKFVGPLYRLEVWLALHLEGHSPSSVRLRPGDELAPLAEKIDLCIQKAKRKRGNQ